MHGNFSAKVIVISQRVNKKLYDVVTFYLQKGGAAYWVPTDMEEVIRYVGS